MIEVFPREKSFAADRVKAVVLDWAGTTVDYGSRAPVMAILNAFQQVGVKVTEQEARRPMGRAKRDHLKELLADEAITQRWVATHGRAATEEDLDSIYAQFLSVQADSVAGYSGVIPGCCEAIAALSAQGVRVGSSTGYTRPLLERVAKRAKTEGFEPEVMLSADDVAPGRPAPWLCIENARRLGVYPMSSVVKVDDTPAGVTAGRNAGAWSVGVIDSGNEVGLSQTEFDALSAADRVAITDKAASRLTAAGAHFLISTIAELPAALMRINDLLADGKTPC